MKIIMAGIDYKNSSIAQREQLVFDDRQAAEMCKRVCSDRRIYGCVVLSTCNRTEIYISCDADMENIAAELIAKYRKTDIPESAFECREGMDAIYHIVELACGLKSQIVGEGQISGQINAALKIARDAGCTDSVLNTLFRIAVSAGKYTLTNAKISNVPLSGAYAAVELLREKFGSLNGRHCLVIGNGKMGRLAQQLLLQKGCDVTVTLRQYRHGDNNVMDGCGKINYSERYDFMDGCDFVISATKSPHFTITADRFAQLKKMPLAVVDLAVPRDVEQAVEGLCLCRNIDTLGYDGKIDDESLDEVYNIIEKFVDDFVQWHNYRASLPHISKIKELIAGRIIKGSAAEGEQLCDDTVYRVVGKTVDMLLGSMKDSVEPCSIEHSRKKIEERAVL